MAAKAPKPVGQITRGKTARNRLRRVDNYLLLMERPLLTRSDGRFANALFVDVGYGAEPFTLLESAERLRRAQPQLPVLGVEIDAERVTAAAPYADAHTHFRLGGFNLPLQPGESVRLIRAFNVLRQYEEAEWQPAIDTLCRHLLPGGLLIEGTSDPYGRIWTANLIRATADGRWQPEALLFSTNFRTGFDPADFPPVLPKNLIHQMQPGSAIATFFAAWNRAYVQTLPHRVWGSQQHFYQTAVQLAQSGIPINTNRRLLEKGYLLWQPQSLPTPTNSP